jgi:hypothetical protein
MNDHFAISFYLADELWLVIIDRMRASDWKQLRQTCRRLNKLTTPLLFRTLYFELCGRCCESLHNVSCNPALSAHVQTLALRRVGGCREFADFDTWAASTHQPGDPGDELALPSDASYYDNKQISNGLLPYTGWIALSRNEKEALYHEYEADRRQAQKEVREIMNTLRFRTPCATEWPLVHPHRAFGSTPADAAVQQFCKAVETLPNLKAIEHESGFLYDDEWACRWGNLYFHPSSVIGDTDCREDEDVEALQLSVVLHSLPGLDGKIVGSRS